MTDLPNLDRIALGPTDIQISSLGIGTWAWGDRMMWQFGKGYGSIDIEAAYQTALAHGINFFDTAELYGRGRSETFLGQFTRKAVRHAGCGTTGHENQAGSVGPLRGAARRPARAPIIKAGWPVVVATKFFP